MVGKLTQLHYCLASSQSCLIPDTLYAATRDRRQTKYHPWCGAPSKNDSTALGVITLTEF
jgi:hypothetical protein